MGDTRQTYIDRTVRVFERSRNAIHSREHALLERQRAFKTHRTTQRENENAELALAANEQRRREENEQAAQHF